jgi:outer membrane immunogenic protein
MRAKTITIGALLALTAGFASSLASQANAADFSLGPLRGTHYGAPMATTHVWDGAYFGGFAGYTDGRADLKGSLQQQMRHEQRNNAFENRVRTADWLVLPPKHQRERAFGFFAGFNYQYDEAVLGFEADFTRIGLSITSSDSMARTVDHDGLFSGSTSLAGETGPVTISGSGTVALNNLMTLRARAGYTMGSFLPFVTAGLALTDYTVTLRATRLAPLQSNTPVIIADSRKKAIGLGLAFGLGADVAVSENAFLRGEWQYAHFPDLSGTKVNINTIRAAAGVKF